MNTMMTLLKMVSYFLGCLAGIMIGGPVQWCCALTSDCRAPASSCAVRFHIAVIRHRRHHVCRSLHQISHIIPELLERRFRTAGSSDKQIVSGDHKGPLLFSKTLSKPSFNPISHHGLSDLPGHHKGSFRLPDRPLEESQEKESSEYGFSPGQDKTDPF